MNINFTLFMQAIGFAAFIWFTARFVWPPLMRAVDARQKAIADGIAAGEEGRQSLSNAEKRIADMMAEARAEYEAEQTMPNGQAEAVAENEIVRLRNGHGKEVRLPNA